MPSASELAPLVIPSTGITLTEKEAEAILEIAYLAIAADRRLSDDELVAFRGMMGRLRPLAAGGAPATGPVSMKDLDRTLDRLNALLERVDRDEHLRTLASDLSPAARELAYKVAYALGLADMDSSDAEFEFDLQLVEALDLQNDVAETLADEVMGVLNG